MQLNQIVVLMKCPSLIEITEKFIETNKNELPKKFFNSNYEFSWFSKRLLSDNLLQYFEEEKLMNFSTYILHRIIQNYLRYNACSRKIIDFVFKCIDSDKPEVSVLLSLIKIDEDGKYFYTSKTRQNTI